MCLALYSMISLPDTLCFFFLDRFTPPSSFFHFAFLTLPSFLTAYLSVYLSRSYFSFISVSVSVRVYYAALIVFSSHSPGMCRHGLIILTDRCDL